jgi:two-component system, sensor histidine kinase
VFIDDDDDLRTLLHEALEHRGHHVKEARNGIDGLALILAEQPDVAIVDLCVSGMNGYEVAQRARAALGNSVRLVTLTGSGNEISRLRALAAGFDTVMIKPVDIALIERMLETSPVGGLPGSRGRR